MSPLMMETFGRPSIEPLTGHSGRAAALGAGVFNKKQFLMLEEEEEEDRGVRSGVFNLSLAFQ
jgi:hypothetical protein